MKPDSWLVFATFGAVAVVLGVCLPLRSAEEAPAATTPPKWSKPVNGLSGRLLVSLEDLDTCFRHRVTLELKNVSTGPLAVLNQPALVDVELRDAKDRPIKDVGFDQSGPIPEPQWGVIPRDAYLGLRIDMTTVGIPAGPRIALLAVGGKAWFLKPGDYSLGATMVTGKKDGRASQWEGMLKLPPVAFTFREQKGVEAADNGKDEAIEQLSSPSQEARDAAAMILKSVFVPTERKRWEPLLSALKVGDGKKEVLAQLDPAAAKVQMGVGTGSSHSEEYRLDDSWMLRCWYNNADDTVLQAMLVESVRQVWVAPGEDFSGVWTTYYVNGQKSHRIHHKDGKYHGKFIAYHPNGSKSFVQHYGPKGIDGEDTGYFPTGEMAYRAYYEDGSPAGTWVWYNEDGSVRTSRKHARQ